MVRNTPYGTFADDDGSAGDVRYESAFGTVRNGRRFHFCRRAGSYEWYETGQMPLHHSLHNTVSYATDPYAFTYEFGGNIFLVSFGSAEMLGWLVNDHAIEPHIPVFDKSARDDGTFSREDFAYDQEHDLYVCPAGKVLTSTGTLVNDGTTLHYRASKYDCDACELKPRCCPKMPARKVPRSIHEQARDVARDIAKTEAYVTSRRERKKIEMLFAHLKRILRLDRLRLRGRFGARDEFLLAATAQNLRKLAKLILPPALKLA
jgi:hypothetical protein